ncbi:MAG: lysine biosynthesis protein LysW [Gemmatimonadetes bacterium]|nr:lysine biosynthesis protein LysW [Gemmatimonadota bacterium]
MSANAVCPVCDATVPLTPDAMPSELVRCRECGSELEVVTVAPPVVREAPMEEEDWGQ